MPKRTSPPSAVPVQQPGAADKLQIAFRRISDILDSNTIDLARDRLNKMLNSFNRDNSKLKAEDVQKGEASVDLTLRLLEHLFQIKRQMESSIMRK